VLVVSLNFHNYISCNIKIYFYISDMLNFIVNFFSHLYHLLFFFNHCPFSPYSSLACILRMTIGLLFRDLWIIFNQFKSYNYDFFFLIQNYKDISYFTQFTPKMFLFIVPGYHAEEHIRFSNKLRMFIFSMS